MAITTLKNEVLRSVASLKPGECIKFSAIELSNTVQGYHYNGVFFTPADRIMENIIGSAYEFNYTENPITGEVTFCRLEAPITYGESRVRTYISPDRR